MTTPTPSSLSARPFSWRAFVSFVVLSAFAVLAVTGIALYATPPVERLKAAGFAASPDVTLERLAAQRGVPPQEVYARLGAGAASAATAGSASVGMGWKTVHQVADELQLPVDTVIARLRRAGIEAGPDEALREIAKRSGRHAPELASLLAQQ
jgi:hypothetical protein